MYASAEGASEKIRDTLVSIYEKFARFQVAVFTKVRKADSVSKSSRMTLGECVFLRTPPNTARNETYASAKGASEKIWDVSV